MVRVVPLASSALAVTGCSLTVAGANVWEPVFPADALPAQKASSLSVRFHDIAEFTYATTVLVGTPPQPVSLVLDLTAADLLVLNHKLGAHTYYDHTKSSTYVANGTNVHLTMDSSTVLDGMASRDRLALIGKDSGHIAADSQLTMELEGPASILENIPPKLDGIFGLGPSTANSTGVPSVMRSLIDQGQLAKPVMGLDFREVDVVATFGGLDERYDVQGVTYFPQATDGNVTWMVPLHGVYVGDKRVVGEVGPSMVANSVGLSSYGPDDQVDALAAALGMEGNRVPCDGPGPNVDFHFGDGVVVTFTKKNYTSEPLEDGTCLFIVEPWRYSPFVHAGETSASSRGRNGSLAGLGLFPPKKQQWVFGISLLRAVYTVLDFGATESGARLGFAARK